MGLSQAFLEVHIAGIAQGPGKTNHAGLADIQLRGKFRGRHKAGVGFVIQHIFSNDPAGFGELCVLHCISELFHSCIPLQSGFLH